MSGCLIKLSSRFAYGPMFLLDLRVWAKTRLVGVGSRNRALPIRLPDISGYPLITLILRFLVRKSNFHVYEEKKSRNDITFIAP